MAYIPAAASEHEQKTQLKFSIYIPTSTPNKSDKNFKVLLSQFSSFKNISVATVICGT